MSNENTPRICPVTGMFLDEPFWGQPFFYISLPYDDSNLDKDCIDSHQTFGVRPKDKLNFLIGNCFATREDAERYAKHLKAMAKLRRLEGFYDTKIGQYEAATWLANFILPMRLNQLTLEEQNALLWPNEEK